VGFQGDVLAFLLRCSSQAPLKRVLQSSGPDSNAIRCALIGNLAIDERQSKASGHYDTFFFLSAAKIVS
jgi:hypothetical protein